MLANLLLVLLLVACGQAQIPEHPGFPEFPLSAVENMAVDTAGACNCACVRTAEVTVAYQTKYNACVWRADRQRLCSTEADRSQALQLRRLPAQLPARLLPLLRLPPCLLQMPRVEIN